MQQVMTKRLLIQVATSQSEGSKVIPVNSGKYTSLSTPIGHFEVSVNIRNFDGSQKHKDNSFYNYGDTQVLENARIEKEEDMKFKSLPNLRILMKFTPSKNIQGTRLLFGNEFPPLIDKHVPVSLISSGLKFFRWYVNPTIESNMHCKRPYIYSTALSGLSGIGIIDVNGDEDKLTSSVLSGKENLNTLAVNSKETIPENSEERWKYFCDASHCENFVFRSDKTYFFVFETNLLKMRDSKYHVAIPTFGSKTLDIDVSKYAKPDLNNFDWVVNAGDSNDDDNTGFILNFSLVEE